MEPQHENPRLVRHMVADKIQVRTIGPIDQLTHQPVQVIKADLGVEVPSQVNSCASI